MQSLQFSIMADFGGKYYTEWNIKHSEVVN